MASGFSDTIGGIATLFGDKPTKPGQLPRKIGMGTLWGYLDTAPASFGLNQVYQPALLGLGSSNLEGLLFGTPDRSYNQTIGFGRMRGDGTYRNSATIKQDVPGSRGLFDLLGEAAPRLQELYNTGARQGAANQFGLLQDFMPQAQQYYEGAAPGLAELRRVLTDQAAKGLKLGGQWNPDDLARVTGSIRGDWARRGLGTSLPALNAETLATLSGGEALRRAREGFALDAANTVTGTTPDYARFILGLGGNPVGDALGILTGQQGLAYPGNLYDPYNPVAGQAAIGAERNRMFDQQQRAAAWGSAIGGGLDMVAGAYTGGMMGAGG